MNETKADRILAILTTKISTFEEVNKLYEDNKDLYTEPASYQESGKIVELLKEKQIISIGKVKVID